jgi:hypothetical protein
VNLARARELQEEASQLATLARTLPDDQRDLALLLGAEGYRIEQSDENRWRSASGGRTDSTRAGPDHPLPLR